MDDDKKLFCTYYNSLPRSCRSYFIIVLCIRIGYTNSRWRQVFRRWTKGDYGEREMNSSERKWLKQLIKGDRWKEEYNIITSQKEVRMRKKGSGI